jgi:hypothetical protein
MKKTTAGSHLTGPVFNLILCLLPLPFLCGLYPIVDFTEERIDVHVYRHEIVVDGFYLYRNRLPFPVHQGLSIPFPVDERHPPPRKLRVRLLNAGQKEIGPLQFLGEQRITLRLDANGSCVVHVQYRQQAPDGDARYILLTTRQWRKPLEKADYRMYTHGVEIVSSNYELTRNRQGYLEFKRENFLPGEDWFFSWKEKKT